MVAFDLPSSPPSRDPSPAAPTLSLRATVCLMPWVAGAAAIAAPRPTRVVVPSPGECPVTSTRRRDPRVGPTFLLPLPLPPPGSVPPVTGAVRPPDGRLATLAAGGRVRNKFIYDDIKYPPGLTGPQRPVRVRPFSLGTSHLHRSSRLPRTSPRGRFPPPGSTPLPSRAARRACDGTWSCHP